MPDDVDLPITKGWKHFVGSITTPSNRQGIQRSLITTASSVSAVLIALTICAVILEVTGKNPVSAYHKMFSTGIKTDKLFESLQRATPLIIRSGERDLGVVRASGLEPMGGSPRHSLASAWADRRRS